MRCEVELALGKCRVDRDDEQQSIIQGIIDSAHCDNIWESGFQNAQEAIASNVLKFLSGSKVSSIFCVGGQDIASKPGSAAKQDMSILSEDVRTDTKSSRESGEHIDMNEKIKHVKSSSIHEPVKPVKRKADIVAISPTSFSVRQGELAKNADHVYNNLIRPIAKRQHQSPVRVLEVVDVPEDSDNYIIIDELAPDAVLNKGAKDDLIILQPKSLLELPIEENEKFPVSNEDCMHYNSIIELAYTKGIQNFMISFYVLCGNNKRYALTYSMVHCNYVSLGQSLMPTGKVDNFLIPCFCRKFFEDRHPTISGKHHFFPHIGENILHYTNEDQLKSIATSFLGAASASRGKRLELSNTLFFPTCLSNHWIVFVVDFKWKLFAFLDSLYDKDSFLHKSIREKFIKNFIRLWEIIFQTDQHNFKRFSRMYPHVPKQENGNECGVFATKIMEIWDATLDLRKIFSQADIQHIRIQYMNQLFFWKKNTADKTLVTSFNFQGDFANNLPR
ncbi:hypothetical protein ZWY2020_058034 [Hordeum vulgare]|nr:hypothetical protein ZWY2020_058034 [Hordeum vulgare]